MRNETNSSGRRAARHCAALLLAAVGFSIFGSGLLVPEAHAQGKADPKGKEPPPFEIGSPVPERPKPKITPPPPGVRDLTWNDLVPSTWNPRAAFDRLNIRNLPDNDPRVNDLLAEIRAEWDRAPVVKKLAGQKVRLPGYITTLEGDRNGVREFLLVPYFGACIHVPAPPSNQVVHVLPEKPVPELLSYYPVWVTGTIEIEQLETALGSAGYTIRKARVEEYGAAAR